MRWRTKAAVQAVFSNLPRGEVLNFFCQRRIFKHLPVDDATCAELAGTAQRHVENLEKHGDVPLADGSVDYVTSTSTLEHIPPDDIRLILRETRRILRPGGVASLWIDYQDHYSYNDPSISVYNYLQFEDRQWKLWSPSLQFQNRLRHADHVRLLHDAGFEILHEDRVEGSPEDLGVIAGLPLASPFRDRDPEELAVRGAFLTVTPA